MKKGTYVLRNTVANNNGLQQGQPNYKRMRNKTKRNNNKKSLSLSFSSPKYCFVGPQRANIAICVLPIFLKMSFGQLVCNLLSCQGCTFVSVKRGTDFLFVVFAGLS